MACVTSGPMYDDLESGLAVPQTVQSPTRNAPHEVWAGLCRHCHDPEFDLRLVTRFMEMLIAKVDCAAAMALLPNGTASPTALQAMRPILRCVRLLHLCEFSNSDIEVIMTYTSVYLEESLSHLEGAAQIQLKELSLIICVLIYIAHSYVLDSTCPLKYWHQHVFASHCDVKTLNQAIFRLMEQRGFLMRIDSEAQEARLVFLREGCASGILSGL